MRFCVILSIGLSWEIANQFEDKMAELLYELDKPEIGFKMGGL